MTTAAQLTPGAIRAGRNISERFRRALPNLPESNAETLAAIIDAETHSAELLEALEALRNWCDANLNGAPTEYAAIMERADAAIGKARP